MKLEVGDVVVYAAYGVGRVAAVEERRIDGSLRKVVVVELSDDLTVSLPIERACEQLRSLATEAVLEQVEEVLRDERVVNAAPWLARQRESQAKLTGGDPVDLAEIVRDGATRLDVLVRKDSKARLPEGERHLFRKARLLLAAEIAQVRGLATTEADDWIGRQLAHSA
jgi:RNA polymerase-interacting CarD/CdnL/TRCF family regulator